MSDPVPKIIRAIVEHNPFEDIVPRNLTKADISQPEAPATVKKQAAKASKDKNLLSFDQEDEFDAPAPPRKGFTSVHEALAGKDYSLSKESVISTTALAEQRLKKQAVEAAKSELLAKLATASAEGDKLDQATKEL